MKKFAVSIFIVIWLVNPTMALAISGDRVSLGYIYNPSKSHTQIVNNSNGNINTVSPTCLDLSDNGHLVINNIFSKDFVDEMHEQNVLVTPFLSNHWSKGKGQAALSNADVLIDEIVEAVNNYNLDGVNVDLENLNAKDRDYLTNFMRMLREKMPKGKIISIAVAANPNKLTTTWLATYDYENLAKYVNYLVLMAYDEHSNGGVAGPVASINFVEESIKVVLENVSRDKVVLGIPLYGRFWKIEELEEGEEPTPGGEAIVMAQVENLAKRYRESLPIYNDFTGTATLTINVESGDKKAYVNGRYLEEGTYTIWYDNEASITKKLDVMNYYGLKGSALWAIGNEGRNFWNYYESKFNNSDYESEQSIKERNYYEQLTRIAKTVEPLRLTVPLKIDNDFEKALKSSALNGLKKYEKEEMVHLPNEKKIEIGKQSFTRKLNEMKIKEFKAMDKISIVHMKRRNSLPSY